MTSSATAAESTTERLLAAKRAKGLTFQDVADKLGRGLLYVAAALHGAARFDALDAVRLGELLDLDDDLVEALQAMPERAADARPVPTDPLIYRLYEMVLVYGESLKAVITEEFGDGIMSAIDFEMHIDRRSDPKGDRVVLTLDGKFLPYRTW